MPDGPITVDLIYIVSAHYFSTTAIRRFRQLFYYGFASSSYTRKLLPLATGVCFSPRSRQDSLPRRPSSRRRLSVNADDASPAPARRQETPHLSARRKGALPASKKKTKFNLWHAILGAIAGGAHTVPCLFVPELSLPARRYTPPAPGADYRSATTITLYATSHTKYFFRSPAKSTLYPEYVEFYFDSGQSLYDNISLVSLSA